MKAIVVGSGAGGATAARELAGHGMDVTVLEAGKRFSPFPRDLRWAEPFRQAGLLFSERLVALLFPHMCTVRSARDLVLVRGITTGGSTALSCGNLVRAERGLKEIGLDLDPEFQELEHLLHPTPIPTTRWRPVTRRMFDAAAKMGLNPHPTPKVVDSSRCVSCGLCELGCATGARWDARRFLDDVIQKGGRILPRSRVKRLLFDGSRVSGVEVARGLSRIRMNADVVVLAAGGIGTPQVLLASRVRPRGALWADVVLTLGGVAKGAHQMRESPMAWYAEHGNYMLSPYPDILCHWFYRPWKDVSAGDRVGLMVKLADEATGTISHGGKVLKSLTSMDTARLDEAMDLAQEVMEAAGVSGPFVRGLANGGHLGGTAALSAAEVPAMRPSWLPENLWIADLSLVPQSQGMPTILTTAAIGLRVSRRIVNLLPRESTAK